jgi:hypothetical protein
MKHIIILLTIISLISCAKETTMGPVADDVEDTEIIEQKVIKLYTLTYEIRHSAPSHLTDAKAFYEIKVVGADGIIKYNKTGEVIREGLYFTNQSITGDKVTLSILVNTVSCRSSATCYTNGGSKAYIVLFSDNYFYGETETHTLR